LEDAPQAVSEPRATMAAMARAERTDVDIIPHSYQVQVITGEAYPEGMFMSENDAAWEHPLSSR
jgi:hypothetical protein